MIVTSRIMYHTLWVKFGRKQMWVIFLWICTQNQKSSNYETYWWQYVSGLLTAFQKSPLPECTSNMWDVLQLCYSIMSPVSLLNKHICRPRSFVFLFPKPLQYSPSSMQREYETFSQYFSPSGYFSVHESH